MDFIACDTETNDMVSYITDKKLKKLHSKDTDGLSYKGFIKKIKADKTVWNNENRTKIKIGRFVNKLANLLDSDFDDEELEEFVNAFKGFNALNRNNSNFQIIKGEDIRKYYLHTSYQKMHGHLSESCMRFKKCQEFFDIYVENPKICKLLILKGEGEKILGRALIWKTTQGFNYLDRVYATCDSDIVLFNEYARIKLNCKHSYESVFKFGGDFIEMSITPAKTEFNKYPYMDSFKFFYKDEGVLYNTPISEDEDRYVELEMTNGLI